jgi:hypothetical protein
VGFVIKSSVVESQLLEDKIEKLLTDALAYLAGDINKRLETIINDHLYKIQQKAVVEAQAFLKGTK